jgi:opacity protein-like surface antigen
MKTACVAAWLLVGVVTPAYAEEDQGAVVGVTAAATTLKSTTAFSFAGTAGYEFTRIAGLELEATAIPTLRSPIASRSVSGGTLASVAQPSFRSNDGRAIFFTTNMRVRLPTTKARLTPFFVAGGGAASVRHSTDVVITLPPLPANLPVPIPRQIRRHIVSSSTDLALTIGGGLDVKLTSHVTVGADLRYFRLLGQEDTSVGRFGVSARYRF